MFGRIERKLDKLISKNEQIQRPNRWLRVGRLELKANWLVPLSPQVEREGYLYRNVNTTPVILTELDITMQVISNPFSASRPMTPDPNACIHHTVTVNTRHNSIMDKTDYCVPVEWFPINETGGIYWGAAVVSNARDTIRPHLIIEPDDYIYARLTADEENDAYHTFPKTVMGIRSTVTDYKEVRW